MTILTAEEIRALVGAVERPSDRLAVYVAAYTGLRAGELCALQRRDADLLGRRLLIGRTLRDERGHLTFSTTTKTDGSRRVVSLPTFLVNMLTEHLATLPTDADALLFTSLAAATAARQASRAQSGTACRASRVQARRPRRSRQTRPGEAPPACTPGGEGQRPLPRPALHVRRVADRGGRHPLEIKTRLGHASITTTMDRYRQLFPRTEAALADALDATYDAGNGVPLDVYASGSASA
jgi:integrase